MKQAIALLTFLFLFSPASYTLAHTYYISPKGNDTNPGTSPQTAWRSIEQVNRHRYTSGDTILFEGGNEFRGKLYFHKGNLQNSEAPLVISSFGEGRATIDADTSFGLYAHNVAGMEVRELNFKGSSYKTNSNSSILFYNDLPGDIKLPQVTIDQVEISGFGKSGITIGGGSGNSGFSDVRITNAIVHDIGLEGINTWGAFDQHKKGYAHSNVYVGHCHVYQVYGLPLPEKHSGSGIVLSDVEGGTIEHSVVHSSGLGNTHCGGSVGIWAWDANRIVIQYNEVYNMSAGGGCDGGGFDLDGGVTNSVMQYNYSHDNDGAGFLIAQFEWARPMFNNVIRYNISENDGRKNGYKGITLWVADQHNNGGNRDLLIYNNTIFADKGIAPSGGGVLFKSGEHHGVQFFNNIFYSRNGAPLVETIDTTALDVSFQQNAYYSENGAYTFIWGKKSHTSLEAFRQGTGQETVSGNPTGITANPHLTAPGTLGTIGYPLDWQKLRDRYSLQRKSPLLRKGIAVPVPMPFTSATHDIVGHKLNPTASPDMGAVAYTRPRWLRWLR
ncbi:right-handed parallel beta-helix repeat-containing protein [Pontibacter sp. JH31]|uniref:Right-handed parallel beta-helix repeat-containing protein n=1 Tax=Pontibacter aquaedesilientis TaxID=2766980 RepID=A0ABR7XEG3_9BACT|nr:right-handed parallel beta-helix repeat-containing protein [Pontibacter aquaedesilientis]MBD1396679.1 right-handed parallel beta-helix repeat-containing protein [Pontibacter aquaedesilientis]